MSTKTLPRKPNTMKKVLAEESLLSLFSGLLRGRLPEKRSGSEEKMCSSEVRHFLISSWVIVKNLHSQVLSPTLPKARRTVWWAIPGFLWFPRNGGGYGQRWIICIQFLPFLLCSHALTIYVCCTGERETAHLFGEGPLSHHLLAKAEVRS